MSERPLLKPGHVPEHPLFKALFELTRGGPEPLREDIFQLKDWFTAKREKRPSGYMNLPRTQSAYMANYLPLHLPELYWIRKQLRGVTLGPQAPRILDYGSGPGTASLAWLLADPASAASPDWTLADISSKALDNAKVLLGAVAPDLKINTRKLPQGWMQVKWRERFDHLILSHVLNEMGSGPRQRDKKLDFLLTLASQTLDNDGLIWIIEPPLREPSLDLMWMRDVLVSEGFQILAPCPAGVEKCPMAARSLGWCYAQPPRKETELPGLLDWDRRVERTMGRLLDHSGFSFIVARLPSPNPAIEVPPHSVAITDAEAWQRWNCTEDGVKQTKSHPAHRGVWKDRPRTGTPAESEPDDE